MQILLLSFLWGAYFSLLTSFAPSYIWFVFLRTMVGGGVSGHAQGLIIKTEFLPTKYRGYMLPLSQVRASMLLFLLIQSPRRFVLLLFENQVCDKPAFVPEYLCLS